MKKSLVFLGALVFMLGIASTTFAAHNPFEDVPAGHWAYKAVNDLYKAGIVEGSAGKYSGDTTVTRYEMAQIVANAMTKLDKSNAETRSIIDKLQAEFANELKSLGTRVVGLEKGQANLEKNQPNIKFNGILTERYNITDYTYSSKATAVNQQYRLRLEGVAKVDDNTNFGMRFVTRQPAKGMIGNDTWQNFGDNGESGPTAAGANANTNNIDRVFVTTKIGNIVTTIGRQQLYVDSLGVVIDAGAFSFDGIKVNGTIGNVNLTANHGRFLAGAAYSGNTLFSSNVATAATTTTPAIAAKADGIASNLEFNSLSANTKFGALDFTLGYYDFYNFVLGNSAMRLTLGNAIYKFNNKLSLNALYINNNASKVVAASGTDVWAVKVISGDQAMNKAKAHNIVYQYVNKKANAFINNFTQLDSTSGRTTALNVDYKMQNFQYNYAFSKSFNASLSYTRVSPAIKNASDADAPNTVKRAVLNYLF